MECCDVKCNLFEYTQQWDTIMRVRYCNSCKQKQIKFDKWDEVSTRESILAGVSELSKHNSKFVADMDELTYKVDKEGINCMQAEYLMLDRRSKHDIVPSSIWWVIWELFFHKEGIVFAYKDESGKTHLMRVKRNDIWPIKPPSIVTINWHLGNREIIIDYCKLLDKKDYDWADKLRDLITQ